MIFIVVFNNHTHSHSLTHIKHICFLINSSIGFNLRFTSEKVWYTRNGICISLDYLNTIVPNINLLTSIVLNSELLWFYGKEDNFSRWFFILICTRNTHTHTRTHVQCRYKNAANKHTHPITQTLTLRETRNDTYFLPKRLIHAKDERFEFLKKCLLFDLNFPFFSWLIFIGPFWIWVKCVVWFGVGLCVYCVRWFLLYARVFGFWFLIPILFFPRLFLFFVEWIPA